MDELLRQVLSVYVTEVQEQAQSIASALLQCEIGPSGAPAYLEEVFRQAHSLKGSSASLGVAELEQLAHALESALSSVRRGQRPLSRELVDAGLAAADAARLRSSGLAAQDDTGQRETEEATRRLLQLALADSASPQVALPPASEPAAAEPSSPPPLTGELQDYVRVAVSRLERLDRDASELRVASGRLTRYSTEAAKSLQVNNELWQAIRQSAEPRTQERPQQLYQLVRGLQTLRRELKNEAELLMALAVRLEDELRAMRLVPASLILEPLQRAAREACRITGREAQVVLQEEQVNLDRALLEELKNPLIHLVRNAVDHGIEASEVREAIGKPPRGTITVKLEQRGELLLISVSDDGRGIDVERVREQAISRGLITVAQAAELDETALLALLFAPGFSTAETVTELSGRGVGLDVVKKAVSRLHGQVTISSTIGMGARTEMVLPLTVAASNMLIIKEGDHTLALPQAAVENIMLVPIAELIRAGTRMFLRDGEKTLTVARLGGLLGLKAPRELPPRLPLLVLRTAGAKVALLCSQILGEEELILRPLPPELREHDLLSAVALSPSGAALFVLSLPALLQEARTVESMVFAAAPEAAKKAPVPAIPVVLVADDSITTRTLLRSVLEAGGYLVHTAADGDEALTLLRSEKVDLVVSDVRMPRLDGLGLISRMRADQRTRTVPVVLFSSLDSEEETRRGEAAGAAAYLSKSAFERGQLFEVVAGLLGRAQ